MPDKNASDKAFTSSKYYVFALLEQAEKKHINTKQLLQQAGISEQEIHCEHNRLETKKVATLVQLMWDALQDENLGYSQQACKPGTFYVMGKLTIHQTTLKKALALGIRFYQQFISDYHLSLIVDGDQVTFRVDQKNRGLDPKHLLSELILIAWYRYSCWLIGLNIPLLETTFSYAPPAHMDEYKFLFPSPHRFNHASTGFSFKKNYLNHPTIQNEKSLKLFMSRCPASLFLKDHWENSISEQIRLQLEKKLPEGLPTISDIANTLNMTSQTLRRKLKSEGSSYQQIKDLVRRDSAQYYLSQQHLPTSEVARLIGFSEPSVFLRAFKHWTGLTPGEYRHSLQNMNH